MTCLFIFPLTIFAQKQGSSSFKYVKTNKIPKPKAPPLLTISKLNFYDQKSGNGNSGLDAGENAEIIFTIKNEGRGSAYEVEIIIENNTKLKDIYFNNPPKIEELKAGESKQVNIQLTANDNIDNHDVEFQIKANEGNGFDLSPTLLNFKTFKFKSPLLEIVDYKFSTNDGGNHIKPTEIANLQFIIQNKGQGIANNIKINIINPEFIYEQENTSWIVKNLQPNQTYIINYGFFVNNKYKSPKIELKAIVSEEFGKWGCTKDMTVALDQVLSKTQSFNVEAKDYQDVAIEQFSLTADVDNNIPETHRKNPKRIGLIIGNEDYSSNQNGVNSEINVEFAVNDASIMKEYFIKTLGIQEDNLYFLKNATAAAMRSKINLVTERIKAMDSTAELFFYYAGHGFPDEITKAPYLIPVDVNATNITDGINLYDMYRKFSDAKPLKATIILDACFSGGGRNEGLLAARGVKVKPKHETITGNLVIMTATSESQTALPYKAKQHGIFTYYLLKKLQESKGDINYSELYNQVEFNVKNESLKVNEKLQNPQVLFSSEIANDWKNWKINE